MISSLAEGSAVDFVLVDSELVNPDPQRRKYARYQKLQLRAVLPIESELHFAAVYSINSPQNSS